MKIRLVDSFFILIGVAVGVILALQIQAKPVRQGSFPLDQLEVHKALLANLSLEQEELKKNIELVRGKRAEVDKIVEQRSSKKTLEALARLKSLVGLDSLTGEGVRITLKDNPTVDRFDFSSLNDNFIQASDLRDLVNALFLQDAQAISINGTRVLPLFPIQSVFDTILIGDIQVSSPFVVEAVGNPQSLSQAAARIRRKQIQIFLDSPVVLKMEPAHSVRSAQNISLSNP